MDVETNKSTNRVKFKKMQWFQCNANYALKNGKKNTQGGWNHEVGNVRENPKKKERNQKTALSKLYSSHGRSQRKQGNGKWIFLSALTHGSNKKVGRGLRENQKKKKDGGKYIRRTQPRKRKKTESQEERRILPKK